MAKPRYSGKHSRKFWKRIRKLRAPDHDVLYALGVELQSHEIRILARLANAEYRQNGRRGRA